MPGQSHIDRTQIQMTVSSAPSGLVAFIVTPPRLKPGLSSQGPSGRNRLQSPTGSKVQPAPKSNRLLGYLETRLRRSARFFFSYNPEPVRLNLPPETKFVLARIPCVFFPQTIQNYGQRKEGNLVLLAGTDNTSSLINSALILIAAYPG